MGIDMKPIDDRGTSNPFEAPLRDFLDGGGSLRDAALAALDLVEEVFRRLYVDDADDGDGGYPLQQRTAVLRRAFDLGAHRRSTWINLGRVLGMKS